MPSRPTAIALFAAAVALAPDRALAADGEPDPAFWGDGLYTASIAPEELLLADLLEAPDGALVWVGSRFTTAPPLSVPRWHLLSDQLEVFVCELPLAGGVRAEYRAAAFDASGRLALAGWAQLGDGTWRLLFARYLYPFCVLDATLDGDGVRLLDLGAADLYQAVMALAADGDALVFAGNARFDPANDYAVDGVVGRLLPDGALDPAFSANGWVALEGRGGYDSVSALALAPGRVYVGGSGTASDGTDYDFHLYALGGDGAPVPGFGVDGLVRVIFGATGSTNSEVLWDLALFADGRVALAGSAEIDIAPGYGAAVAVVGPDGELDPAFGAAGRFVAAGHEEFRSVAVQSDGRLVVAAHTWAPSDGILVMRLLPDGTWDPDWNWDSPRVVFPASGLHSARALALQAGRVVLGANLIDEAGPNSAGVARLSSALIFADSFEIGATWFWSSSAP